VLSASIYLKGAIMAGVILKHVVKRFGKNEVVHDFCLEGHDREFIVLVGPSGCGKSTILRMIAGLEQVSGGEIFIGARRVNDLAPKDRDAAMVFQNYALYPHMSVYENMAFGLKLRKTPAGEIRQRVEAAARILGLEELLRRRPHELSGGQRQRVAMGRAIVRQPAVFLFDEPLSNLDAKLRTQMRTEIKRLHRRVDATAVYVTHDQIEAMTLADRIVVLRDGGTEQIGTPLEIFQRPINTFVAGFIGSPPMNIVPASLKADRGGWHLALQGGVELSVPERPAKEGGAMGGDGMPVLAGLRPEDLWVGEAVQRLPAAWVIGGRVEVVEPLGSETLLHLDLQGIPAVAKCEGHTRLEAGATIQAGLNLEHLHIFDAGSRRAIY
jgi:multiple sugar transport system ATP-binding protein